VAWFSFRGTRENNKELADGSDHVVAYTQQLIEDEFKYHGIQSQNVYIGGWSQGGAIAAYVTLIIGGRMSLGGGVSFGGWVINQDKVYTLPHDYDLKTKLIFSHGTLDHTVRMRNLIYMIRPLQRRWLSKIKLLTYDGAEHNMRPEMHVDAVNSCHKSVDNLQSAHLREALDYLLGP